jgi:hypothetical protein
MAKARARTATATAALIPAAARADTTLDDVEAVLNCEAIEVFARAVGGRAQLADTLAVAATSPDVARITTCLLDPRYASWSLARLCHMVGITVAELFASYRKAMIARAHIEATHTIARTLPAVVSDVMDKATPQPIVCPHCQGRQTIAPVEPGQAPLACPVCRGTGSVQSEPTVERHKLALELGQLIEKKGGLLIQQNNLAPSASALATGSLEQLQQAVGDVLFGSRRQDEAPLDVEAHPVPDPDDHDPLDHTDDDDALEEPTPDPRAE